MIRSSHLYLQFLGGVVPQEVPDLLVVYLDVAHPHVEHRVVVLLRLLPLEYMNNGAGNETYNGVVLPLRDIKGNYLLLKNEITEEHF